ncbi:MAG TPA: hypothetical protein VKK31_18790 [Thermoanaerobaculia bacterium]|nr:hypothetical protein [Thermoanaerobaculia bacterium]
MKSRFAMKAVWAAILLVSILATGASAQTLPMAPSAEKVCAETALPPSDLLLPQPTLTCGPYCMPTQRTTATISGSGSNCTNAQNSLNSQLQSIAQNRCVNDLVFLGSCSVVIHNTTSCTLIAAGTYQIQGYATFHCKETNC